MAQSYEDCITLTMIPVRNGPNGGTDQRTHSDLCYKARSGSGFYQRRIHIAALQRANGDVKVRTSDFTRYTDDVDNCGLRSDGQYTTAGMKWGIQTCGHTCITGWS